jgi:hypothetical protein
MSTTDGRFELVTAIALTSNRVKVKGTRRSFVTTPADLFKLRLNDKRVGITGRKVLTFKRRLAKLLSSLNFWIDRIPDDSGLLIEELADYLRTKLIPPAETVHGSFEFDLPPAKKKKKKGEAQTLSRGPIGPIKQLERLRYSSTAPSGGRKLSNEFLLGFGRRRGGVDISGKTGAGRSSPLRRRPMGGGRPPLWMRAKRGDPALYLSAKELRMLVEPRKTKPATPRASKAVVSTGFAHVRQPGRPIKSVTPLTVNKKYYFWLQVGKPVLRSIETKETSLPVEKLPERPRLKVALFDFDDGLRITKGADIGKIQLDADNTASVIKQPSRSLTPRPSADLRKSRLFFPVRTSSQLGESRLRCNIYCEQVLVQSRLIRVFVSHQPKSMKRALSSTLDYKLAQKVSPSHVARMKPHRLSLMLNDNGNGTHGFRFFGEHDFKRDATFDVGELQNFINDARAALRMAAWGDKNPWKPDRAYRYAKAPLNQLKADLISFAKVGFSFYDQIVDRLSGSYEETEELTALMKTPGLLQIALKQSARHVLPAALFYDYRFDTNLKATDYQLCPGFLKAMNDAGTPLENSDCFKGNCPTKDSKKVVCPSGFWGYRHSLGMPLSLPKGTGASSELFWKGQPEVTVGVSTDKDFVLREKHELALKALRTLTWNYAATREDVFKLLREKNPQLVYFYCHGGISGTLPFILVGPKDEIGITRDNLRSERIRWKSPRPLVFINGCHTAALEPDVAIEFISAFVSVANACGVIGTEITIFEPLAKAFAEECLRRFLNGDQIGDAIRGARLKLLKEGNPLGLVYIPYVMADLRMVEAN